MKQISATIVAVIGLFIGFAVLVFGLGLLLSLPVMWLWDWIMPTLFGLKTITWLQAWGLSMLCSFLFKSHSTSK